MISAEQHRGFIREITVFTQGTDAQMRAAMVRGATTQRDRVLMEQGARAGIVPRYRQIVDGVEGASLDTVSAKGRIVFIWNYLAEVIEAAMVETAQSVPVRTGNLLQHIFLFVDGTEAGRDGNGEATFELISSNTKTVTIVVDVDYARRLEVGRTKSGGSVVMQVKPHFIQQAAIVLQRRFRDQATILFNFTTLGTTDTVTTVVERRRRHRRGADAMSYPSITITAKTT